MRAVLLSFLIIAVFVVAFFIHRTRHIAKPPPPLSKIYTLTADKNELARFNDPFGVAVAKDGAVFVTDGETGKLRRIAPDGTSKVIAENLDVPSAIAIAPDNSLVVVETGMQRIVRVDVKNGQVEAIAGIAGRSGFADGGKSVALFNAPVGLTVARDNTIFVADTYNDRIRTIDANGNIRTIAGGETGFADGVGDAAKFDTPCGIAVLNDNSLVVADTGNHRLRRVMLDGSVTTLAGNGEARETDGELFNASFNEPTSVAVDADGMIYVADAAGSALRLVKFDSSNQTGNDAATKDSTTSSVVSLNFGGGRVSTFVGGFGLNDGDFSTARVSRPSGIALTSDGTIVFADTGNGLVRVAVGVEREHGALLDNARAKNLLTTNALEFRAAAPSRWCFDPPQQPRELAATFGEVRGFVEEGKEAHFHNGLDVPGALGEVARAVRTARVLRPLSVNDVGTARERIRFPTLGYIHVRIGRDANEKNLDANRFILRRDEKNHVVGVRVRRGEKFNAGDAIGTLNTQYHCHLIAGRTGAEINALAALELPGVRDTVAPTIEDVRFFNRDWQEFPHADDDGKDSRASKKTSAKINRNTSIVVNGDARIVVRAFDRMNDNQTRRRLGVYRLGYQILKLDGTPANDFNEPRITISFERLPKAEDAAVRLVYASHSQAGYSPQAIFDYIVTNTARDGTAQENFWRVSDYPSGDYTVRVFAEDFFGNRTTRDVKVRVSSETKQAN